MAVEKFIRDRLPFHKGHHDGMHATMKRLAEAEYSLREYRQQRIASHERGFDPEPIEEFIVFDNTDLK